MTWLMSERNTWSLDAMLLSGMLGMAEWTAKASMRLGVATKLPKVAAASYPKGGGAPRRQASEAGGRRGASRARTRAAAASATRAPGADQIRDGGRNAERCPHHDRGIGVG